MIYRGMPWNVIGCHRMSENAIECYEILNIELRLTGWCLECTKKTRRNAGMSSALVALHGRWVIGSMPDLAKQ